MMHWNKSYILLIGLLLTWGYAIPTSKAAIQGSRPLPPNLNKEKPQATKIAQPPQQQSEQSREPHHTQKMETDAFPTASQKKKKSEEEVLGPRLEKGVNDFVIVKEAQWALHHLQGLSESGIYKTLTLRRILAAAKQVELESPHLLGGIPYTMHELIVMEALDDGAKSFAIDEFPVMDPEAVEEFWMRMVDEHRRKRDEVFSQLDEVYKGLSTKMRADSHQVQDLDKDMESRGFTPLTIELEG